ncbi:MAG TPA: DUF4292 domain-containing protein [Blastocatellia bacterium]|nr:DUF4292 domain-containing protein [Blastocatellia bacterium]
MSREIRSKRHLKTIIILSLLALAVTGLAVLALSRRVPQQGLLAIDQNSVPAKSNYVSRAKLWPQLRDAIKMIGDRLEKKGKERLILNGQLSRYQGEKQNVRLIVEYPDKLRLEETGGVTVFDGKALKSSKVNLSKREEDEIESFLSDTPEHFFLAQMQGQTTRFLGSRFRLDDSIAANYDGPFYEIYQVQDQVALKQEISYQTKLYYFNSDTLLIERVRYENPETKSKIEVRFSGWQKFGDQLIPGMIEKIEDGVSVLSLKILTATISPKTDDGIFSALSTK